MPALITLFLATLLYAFLVQSLPTGSFDRWQAVAFFNSGLLLLLFALDKKFKIRTPSSSPSKRLRYLAWALPLFVISGAWALVSLSPEPGAEGSFQLWEILGLCLAVPIIEEFLFRRFLASWLGQRYSPGWALYLSALLFALAHTAPPVMWPPLGPFLLGLCATWCYQATGRIAAPILLHAACNASAVLFTLYSPRWLDQLSWLYQRL